MESRIRIALVVMTGMTICTTQVIADTIRGTSGRPVMINREASWDRNCRPTAFPQIAYQQQPAHGSLSTASVSFTIRQAQAGGAQCIGRPGSGEAIYYTSGPGFHGTDTVRFTTTYPNGVVREHEKTIVIR